MSSEIEFHPDDYGGPAATTIVTINNRKMVAGLHWQPLSHNRAYMKEAREIGREMQMDIVAIRRTRASGKSRAEVRQAGFVSKGKGVTKGMYSLAAALAGTLGRSWIGVFELDDGRYALAGVHGGSIESGCDAVGDRDDIEVRFSYLRQARDWEALYVPPDFQVGGQSLNIYEVLNSKALRKEYRLRQLTLGMTTHEVALLAILALILVGAGYAYMEFNRIQEEKARVARMVLEQQRLAELEAVNARAREAQHAKALDHPWTKLSTVSDFAGACASIVDKLPLNIAGWPFQSAKCEHDQIAITYRRDGTATVIDFMRAVQTAYGAEPAFFSQGDGGGFSLELKAPFGGDEAIRPVATAIAEVVAHFQAMGQPVAVTERPFVPKVVQPLPGQDPGAVEKEIPPPWKTYEFAAEGKWAPEVVLSGLAGSGLRMIGIGVVMSKESSNLEWKYAGEIYGN